MQKTMKTEIHEAMAADLDDLLSLYRQLGEDDGTVLDRDEARRIFKRILSYPDYRLYLARDLEGRAVGTFALLIMDNLGHCGARSAVIEDVVVAPDCRGRGIGSEMMAFAAMLCRAGRCYKITLSSNRNRVNAHRFYEELGFTRHGYSFLLDLPREQPGNPSRGPRPAKPEHITDRHGDRP
jgi:GNAT superfamily N-acetyltransferase